MECAVCSEPYDGQSRRPKCLPCGHTLCLQCLQHPNFEKKCPQDRKPFNEEPANLPDNFAIVGLLTIVPPRRRVGCVDCGAELTDACAEAGHQICTMRQLQAERVQPAVQRLQRELDAGKRLEQMLERVLQVLQRLDPDVRSRLGNTRQLLLELEQTLQQLQAAVDEGGDLKKALAEASALADRLYTLEGLLPAKAKCSVLLEADGAEWQGCVEVDDQPLLQHALTLLLEKDLLRKTVGLQDSTLPGSADFAKEWNVKELCESSTPNQQMVDALQDEQRIAEVRRLTGVYCGQHPQWVVMLLQAVAPRLEELHVSNARLEHLEVIKDMAALRKLDVGCAETFEDAPDLPLQLEELKVKVVKKNHLLRMKDMPALRKLSVGFTRNDYGDALDLPPQLEEVEVSSAPMPIVLHLCLQRLPKLRRLALRDPRGDEITFPTQPVQHDALQSLTVRITVEKVLLSVISALATTVSELVIVVWQESHIYAVAEMFKTWRFQRLQRLVLSRDSSKHSQYSCKQQVTDLWNSLLRKDPSTGRVTVVTVLCSQCHKVQLRQAEVGAAAGMMSI